jgi:hypothetical protein
MNPRKGVAIYPLSICSRPAINASTGKFIEKGNDFIVDWDSRTDAGDEMIQRAIWCELVTEDNRHTDKWIMVMSIYGVGRVKWLAETSR